MSPLTLKKKEDWIKILEEVSDATQMASALTDEEGNIIEVCGQRSPLCVKIRENQKSLTFICSQCNRSMLKEAKKGLKPILDCCDAGFSRMVLPIIYGQRVVGQITACGSVLNKDEIDSFYIAKQIGLNEEDIMEMADSMPVVSEDKIKYLAAHIYSDLVF